MRKSLILIVRLLVDSNNPSILHGKISTTADQPAQSFTNEDEMLAIMRAQALDSFPGQQKPASGPPPSDLPEDQKKPPIELKG